MSFPCPNKGCDHSSRTPSGIRIHASKCPVVTPPIKQIRRKPPIETTDEVGNDIYVCRECHFWGTSYYSVK